MENDKKTNVSSGNSEPVTAEEKLERMQAANYAISELREWLKKFNSQKA